jgi:hypothetical protein
MTATRHRAAPGMRGEAAAPRRLRVIMRVRPAPRQGAGAGAGAGAGRRVAAQADRARTLVLCGPCPQSAQGPQSAMARRGGAAALGTWLNLSMGFDGSSGAISSLRELRI